MLFRRGGRVRGVFYPDNRLKIFLSKICKVTLGGRRLFPMWRGMSSFKTQGFFHYEHALGFHADHGDHAQKQLEQKPGRDEARGRGKVRKALRNHRARETQGREIFVDSETLKFPPLGHGISIWRENICEWDWEQENPPTAQWKIFRQEQGKDAIKQVEELIRRIHERHSGYISASGTVEFYKKPEAYAVHGRTPKDYRIHGATTPMPKWDSEALSESLRAGEIPMEEFEKSIMEPMHEYYAGDEHTKALACGCPHPLVYIGLDWHTQDGTLHTHPRYLKSAPLGFRDVGGEICSRGDAPKPWFRKPGTRWVGGKVLGLHGKTGKLVTNSLGVALCAADAWREEGFPTPVDFGDDWGMLDRKIEARCHGALKDGRGDASKVENRARDAGLGLPADLLAARCQRGLVRKLAEKNPAFKERRDKKLSDAKEKAKNEKKRFVEIFAKELLEDKDAEVVRQTKAHAATVAGVLPEWVEVVRKNMCGISVPHAKIANRRHASGRLVLQGTAEVELVLTHFPGNQVAKNLLAMLAAHDAALAAYDADVPKHGIAHAEKQLANREAGWRQQYPPAKPSPVQIFENHTSLKGSLRCVDDIRFVTNTIAAAFRRYSLEPEKFILAPCAWSFIELEPSTKKPRIRRDVFESFMVMLKEIQAIITARADSARVGQAADCIKALREAFVVLNPLFPSPAEEPAAPDISEIEDAQRTEEPQNNQPRNPKGLEI